MNNINLISDVNSIKEADKKYIKDKTLIFGLNDNTVNCLLNNSLVNIISSPKMTYGVDSNRKIEIPMEGNRTIKILISEINIQANETGTFSFFETFEEGCFFITGTHVKNDTINGFSMEIIDKTSFSLTVSGGQDNEVFKYFAIGI